MTPEARQKLRELAEAATAGPWKRCHHLESAENDASCPCGYRGGIWGGDGEHVVLEMGAATTPPGQEGLDLPRYSRPQELANAAYIAAVHPGVVIELLDALDRAEAQSAAPANAFADDSII